MAQINKNLFKLDRFDSFSEVSCKVKEFQKNNKEKEVISLGVGDVSFPVVKPVIKAMKKAVDDLKNIDTFKGYGFYFGHDFLKEKILENDYENFNFSKDEIYISNGTKSDSTNILELFDINSKIGVSDLMYPVYQDGANCLNRKVSLLKSDEHFKPIIPKEKYDIIYLCSPCNPTGIAYTYDELDSWVQYAVKNNCVLLYDNVYDTFIRSKDVPKSIYEIKDSKKVAIEFRSFSKKASFTGVRCSYYVIPSNIDKDINRIWQKRTISRYNGCDYIAQRGAEATYLNESQKLINKNINEYLSNAEYLRNSFIDLGFEVHGGIDSPFLWVKCKDNLTSWEMFDLFLNKLYIVIIPGEIFGYVGKHYFRVSALVKKEVIQNAIERMKKYYEKK